jgi:hypothetical protein
MNPLNSLKISVVLIVMLLAGLACNLPASDSGTGQSSPEVQEVLPSAEQSQLVQQSNAPTQVLPRPTHPQSESQLPKPSIPVPPSQTTRQPQAQIVIQPTESTQQNPPAEPDPQSADGTGEFYIVNDTAEMVICYFYMAFSSDSEWGPDRLGESDVIYPDETYTLTEVPFGTFDAQALDCEGGLLAEVYGFDFPPNDTFTLFDD